MACAATVLGAPGARADGARVAVIEVPDNLREAIATTLAAWQVEVLAITGEEPGATMPISAQRARALAERHAAVALVWIATAADAGSLWVYDLESDRVVASELAAEPPFDEPTAAAVALSVKTLLRHSVAAPPHERYGADAAPPPPPPPRAAASPIFGVEAATGMAIRPSAGQPVELRLGIGLLWYPASLGGAVGLAAGLHAGPGIAVEGEAYGGRYSDLAVAVSGRWSLALGPRVSVVPAAGATLHVTSLDGAVDREGASSATRLNPSLDGGASLRLRVYGAVRLDLRVEGSLALRRQRYLVRGVPVLDLPVAEARASLAVIVPFQRDIE